MARPAKAIDTNSMKMSKKERKDREENEKKLRGDNNKIKPFSYLTKRQKAIFKDILNNLNKDILSNLDTYLLNQTAITIERLESIEKAINEASKVTDDDGKVKDKLDAKTIINLKSVRDMYSKDFFRCCNELSLSPQARAKISINTTPQKKKTLMDILNEDDDDNEE
jgi:P27 family predicted phage terminase small subunit